MAVKSDTLQIKFTTDGRGRVTADLNGVSKEIAKLDQTGASVTSRFVSMKGAIAGLVGAGFIQWAAGAASEYQRLNAVLTTITGSADRAGEVFKELEGFAQRTPFQLNEVVTAYAKLQARGIKPTQDLMTSLGNTASAMGKSLDQAVEALADAATGEMERLKEFGIVARQQGEQVAFTFQGTTTVVERNADAIVGYLEKIGTNDFAGAMDLRAKTLEGSFSNLQDATTKLAAAIGNGLTPAMTALAGVAADAAKETTSFFEWAIGKVSDAEIYEDKLRSLTALQEGLSKQIAQQQRIIDETNPFGAFGKFDIATAKERIAELKSELADVQAQFKLTAQAQMEALMAGSQSAKADDAATAAVAKRSAVIDEMIKTLGEETETLGLSKSALLEREKATVTATVADAGQRAELERAFDALIAKKQAEEQSAKATADNGVKSRAAAAALKEWTEQAKVFSGVQSANAEATAETNERISAATEVMRADVMALMETLDPAAQAWREYGEAVREAQAMVIAGQLSGEDMNAAIEAAQARLTAALAGINDANNDAIRQSAEDALTDVQKVWLNGMDQVGDGITDSLMSGFQDGGDAIKDALRNLLRDMLRIIIQQKLVIPLQAQMLQGAGFSGSQIQQLIPGAMPQSGGVGGGIDMSQGPTQAYGGGQGSGAAGSVFGQGGWGGAALGAAAAIGSGYIGGTNDTASTLGGAATGAMMGLQVGGPIGAIIGAIIGAVVGFVSAQDPYLEVSSSTGGINRGRVEGHARSQLGDIYVGKDDLTLDGNMSSQELADRIAAVDNALAEILDSADLAAAREALARFDVNQSEGSINPEKIIEQRMRMVINAVEPEFARFLNGISDIEERMRAFGALRQLREYVEDFDAGIDLLATDGLTKLRTQMNNLDEAVTTTAADLADALASKDIEGIAAAAEAAKQAIVRRYQAEIELANQLASGIENAERAMRSFNLNIAQRIAGVGGSQGAVLGVTAANVAATRAGVLNARDTEQALRHLDEFVSAVDQWLQQSRAAVQAWYNEQAAALQNQLAALDSEQAGIISNAQIRAEMEAQWQAQAQQAAQAALDAERRALEEQLRLAQEWIGVLDNAEQMIRNLVQSTANPLSGFGRLSLLDADINRVRGEFAANGSAATANELAELLQQRLQLAGELFDRPSGEYLAIYNNTLRELSAIRDAARGPAEQAALLQEQLNALQQAGNDSFNNYASADLSYTVEEQARLEAIDAERARIAEAQRLLDEEAAARLAAINEEARAYYEWAQVEGTRLQTEWRDEQIALLAELTGGLGIDEFIAQRQAESTELLGDIRDDLRAFLDLLAGNVAGGGSGGIGGGGGGYIPRDPGDTVPRGGSVGAGSITVPLDISLNVDGAKFGRYVAEVVIDKAGMVAPAIKRASRVA